MEKVKIYLDEDVRPLLAKILRQRGYDVVSCAERDLYGLSDEGQLKEAIKEGRAILTHNIKDFIKLHNNFSDTHCGILLSNQVAFPLLLKRTLKFLATNSAENTNGQLFWLSNY